MGALSLGVRGISRAGDKVDQQVNEDESVYRIVVLAPV